MCLLFIGRRFKLNDGFMETCACCVQCHIYHVLGPETNLLVLDLCRFQSESSKGIGKNALEVLNQGGLVSFCLAYIIELQSVGLPVGQLASYWWASKWVR